MYKRVSYEQMKKREKRRRKAIRVGCALLMAAAAGTTSFVLAVKALAAPEDPAVEAEANRKEEIRSGIRCGSAG